MIINTTSMEYLFPTTFLLGAAAAVPRAHSGRRVLENNHPADVELTIRFRTSV